MQYDPEEDRQTEQTIDKIIDHMMAVFDVENVDGDTYGKARQLLRKILDEHDETEDDNPHLAEIDLEEELQHMVAKARTSPSGLHRITMGRPGGTPISSRKERQFLKFYHAYQQVDDEKDVSPRFTVEMNGKPLHIDISEVHEDQVEPIATAIRINSPYLVKEILAAGDWIHE